MGNTISEHVYQERMTLINKIIKKSKDYSRLDIENRVGFTDYIDFIALDEMNGPVMYGVDVFNRNFVVIKMKVDDEIISQTFFKRYSKDEIVWMGCGHATKDLLIYTEGGIKNPQFSLILDIIEDRNPVLEEKHIPCKNSWIGKKVSLVYK
jgi:hypothetical protein